MANLSYEDRKAIERYLNENGYLPSDNDELEEIFNIERDDNGNVEKVISIYDFQVPSQSIEVGEAIKVSDLTQELGYTTKYDNRQYILMNYEITDNGNINPTVKDFSEPSSFELQEDADKVISDCNAIIVDVINQMYNKDLLVNTDFFPYIKRIYGWQYEKKECYYNTISLAGRKW